MIKALEAQGAQVVWPEKPKGPVMEPVDNKMYWFAVPGDTPFYGRYQNGSRLDSFYCESFRIFHTKEGAIERNEQEARGEWKMVHVPTFLQDLWDTPGVEVPVAHKIEKLFHPQP